MPPTVPFSQSASRPRPGRSLLVAGLCLLGLASASAAPAHEHGALTLALAVEGSGFSIDLESPLDNLLGFERAPRTDKERQAVRALAQQLRSGALFVANADAGCRIGAVALTSGVLAPALLGEAAVPAPAQVGHDEHAGHADLDASLSYTCSHPQALRSLNVLLADRFRGIQRVTVQLATPRGQSQQVLRGPQRQLRW
jgi:hypothetical protein